MSVRNYFWAPAGAMTLIIMASVTEVQRGAPPTIPEAVPIRAPNRAEAPADAIDSAARDPFQPYSDAAAVVPGTGGASNRPSTTHVAAPSPAPEPARMSVLPELTGTLEQDNQRFAVTADGLVPEGGHIGPFLVVEVRPDHVILETDHHQVRLQVPGASGLDDSKKPKPSPAK